MLNTSYEWNGTTLTVKPAGELDSKTSPAFEAELRQILPGADMIIVDFEQINYISSAGLRVLLAIEQHLESRDASMKLIHVNAYILEIFDLVGFQDVVTVE